MKKIDKTEELIAAAARQGVEVNMTEAKIVLGYMESHGSELLMGEKYELTLHDQTDGDSHDADEAQTIRDIIELCKELNEELLLDACSTTEPDAEEQLDLRKDGLIIEGLLTKAAAAVPPTLRRYNMAVVEHWKKTVPVVAASWAEAKMKVEQMWKDGEVVLSSEDFAGASFTQEG